MPAPPPPPGPHRGASAAAAAEAANLALVALPPPPPPLPLPQPLPLLPPQPPQPQPPARLPPRLSRASRELLAGCAAGAANVASGYPFDTVKVRLQSAPPGRYRGPLHCFRQVLAAEGVRRGLYRGMSPPLLGGAAETGVNYLVYSRVLQLLSPPPQPRASGGGAAAGPPVVAPLHAVAVAGAVAGFALSFILGPTELIKCRLQAAGSAARYPGGPLQVVRCVLAAEGGGTGLLRGLGATLAREVPGNALFFTAYEALRRSLSSATAAPAAAATHAGVLAGADGCVGAAAEGAQAAAGGPSEPAAPAPGANTPARPHWLSELGAAMLCGGTAGTLMWAAVMPIDVAKTRLQTARPGDAWDVGLLRHWAMLWREGRVASLYAGVTPTLLRAFPANAAQWLAWEACMRGMGGGA